MYMYFSFIKHDDRAQTMMFLKSVINLLVDMYLSLL